MIAKLWLKSIEQELDLMTSAAIAFLELCSVEQAYERFMGLFHITNISLLLVDPRAVHNHALEFLRGQCA